MNIRLENNKVLNIFADAKITTSEKVANIDEVLKKYLIVAD
jgi:hypothetical protein